MNGKARGGDAWVWLWLLLLGCLLGAGLQWWCGWLAVLWSCSQPC